MATILLCLLMPLRVDINGRGASVRNGDSRRDERRGRREKRAERNAGEGGKRGWPEVVVTGASGRRGAASFGFELHQFFGACPEDLPKIFDRGQDWLGNAGGGYEAAAGHFTGGAACGRGRWHIVEFVPRN